MTEPPKIKIHEKPSFNLVPKIHLTDLQDKGIRFSLSRKGAILNLSTGAGKTFLALHASVNLMECYEGVRVVIFCPAGANRAWRKDLTTLGENYAVFEADKIDCKTSPEKVRFWIFNFSSMEKYEDVILSQLNSYKCIGVIDEAHLLGSSQTRQSRALKYYRKRFYLTWALTATPLMSLPNIRALYNLVDFIFPAYFGRWEDFKKDFLVWRWENIRGAGGKVFKKEEILSLKNVEVLKERLGVVMFVGTVSYNVDFKYYETNLSSEEWDYYRQAGQGILKDHERGHFASRLPDLQRVIDNSHETLPEHLIRKISSKERLLFKVLKEEILDKDLSVLIFVEHLSTAERLENVLAAAKRKGVLDFLQLMRITGKESKKERDSVETRIRPKTIIIATKAGSMSRNLQLANNVMFYDLPFSLSQFLQSVGRVTRIDSKFEGQIVHILTAKNTLDEYKLILAKDNSHIVSELFGGNTNLPDTSRIDRQFITDLRRKLLWGFKKSSILSLDELSKVSLEEMEKEEVTEAVSFIKTGDVV